MNYKNNCTTRLCPKGGVKIHETNNNNSNQNDYNNNLKVQNDFYNNLKNQNRYTGVRIEKSNNEYGLDPFDGLDPFKSLEKESDLNKSSQNNNYNNYNNKSLENLDLNIDHYSREDLYKLFGLNTLNILTENSMRESKKIVLKMHPDKSRLEPKYFLFYSSAYKRLFQIYEFQNKTSKKNTNTDSYSDSLEKEKADILNHIFENKKELNLKDPKNFNKWFNEQFDKHKLDDPNETGYGDWLKSDEGINDIGNVSKANMASEFEKQKKKVQALTTYNGINDPYASTFGGSSLMNYTDNYTSGTLFSNDGMGYTDLRQAYNESVIPVTEDDFNKVKKFKNVNEYKAHRDTVDVTPIDKETALRKLMDQNKKDEQESAALAYYYAKREEKVKEKEQSFWSGLKQLTNW